MCRTLQGQGVEARSATVAVADRRFTARVLKGVFAAMGNNLSFMALPHTAQYLLPCSPA
jgi:hypothetical protein